MSLLGTYYSSTSVPTGFGMGWTFGVGAGFLTLAPRRQRFLGVCYSCKLKQARQAQPMLFLPRSWSGGGCDFQFQDTLMREKMEAMLYTLQKLLPGHLDHSKMETMRPMFSKSVKFQNPLVCFQGIDSLNSWLQVLAEAQAFIDLHEIYSENMRNHRGKYKVHTVWTITLAVDFQKIGKDLGLHHPVMEVWNAEKERGDPCKEETESDQQQSDSELEIIRISGETVLEMDLLGLVSRISSRWYVLQEEDGSSFATMKQTIGVFVERTFK
ncbi:hypothetical protein O6H91_20G016300 [Diphasiastrum complanatum]|uniref:Uncharacterized protein n=1 Tax=Diphasiastrum complanatum TaxID=34168 RepID=A0ACC2AN26_DIPCM|nr:hypothetical protein O6H91_20G016300 [Diphasiastrum complanatum]